MTKEAYSYDVRIVPTAAPPMFVFRSEAQADALLRQIDGRSLSEDQKRWLRHLADDLRSVAIPEFRYGKWDGKADGLGTPSNPRPSCGHCHTRGMRVNCRRCSREMCENCISDGQLCGLCYDEEERAAR